MRFVAFLLLFLVLLSSCIEDVFHKENETVLITEDDFLPEKAVVYDSVSGISARYIYPTLRYDHGILGDEIEAGALMITVNEKQFVFELDSFFVFEDIQPRLVDLDNDAIPEIITIMTELDSGAAVAIFKFEENKIVSYAASDFIGRSYRWLNIAAVADLDFDGEIEIAYVTTPHIGGVLNIARVSGAKIEVVARFSGVSNHKIRTRNLCLSVVDVLDDVSTLYVPNNSYDSIVGFQMHDDQIVVADRIAYQVDTNRSLSEQYIFNGELVLSGCINAQ